MRHHTFATAIGVALVVATASVAAQQPAADEPSAQQTAPKDDSGGFINKIRRYIEQKRLVDRFGGGDDGFYLRFGGMTTGSGIAAGPGYRQHLFDRHILLDVSGALSTKVYKAVDVHVRWLQLAQEHVEVWTDFRYQDFPEEDFFGLGPASSLDARTNYALESTDVSARALVRITPWLRSGVDLGYFSPTIDRGTDDAYPSIEERFTDLSAPGLAAQPKFRHHTVFGEIDYRDQRGSPTKGGFYRFSFGTWNDTTLDQFDFHRFDGSLAQYVSLMPRHVVGGHVGFSYVNNELNQRVPFYFLPYVGGSDTVRGFREFRFRDENILFLNAEYRWQALKPMDLAFFVDAGEVRPDWEDIDRHDLKTSWGGGVRFHTPRRTFVRIDVGTGGREGTRLFFKLGPSF